MEEKLIVAEGDRPEPLALPISMPVWLMVITSLLFFDGMLYVERKGGGFDTMVYAPYPDAGYLRKVTSPGEIDPQIQHGRELYSLTCSGCHQLAGTGNPGQAPPLAGSPWVLAARPDRLIRIANNGLTGPIEVSWWHTAGSMPNVAQSVSDADLADILSYIRNVWGNNASVISPDDLARVRKEIKGRQEQWAPEELLAIPVD